MGWYAICMRAIAPLLLRSLDHLRPPAKANKQPFHHPDDPSPLDALVLQAAQQRQSRVDLRLHAAVRRRLRQHVGARRAYPLPHQPRRVQASAGRATADLRDDRTIRVTRQLIVLSGEQQVSDSFIGVSSSHLRQLHAEDCERPSIERDGEEISAWRGLVLVGSRLCPAPLRANLSDGNR